MKNNPYCYHILCLPSGVCQNVFCVGLLPEGQKRRCVREAGTQQIRQENRMRRVILAAVIFCFCIAVVIVDNLETSSITLHCGTVIAVPCPPGEDVVEI